MKNNILRLAVGVLASFILLIGYLSYLQIFRGEFLATHPKNPRVIALEKAIIRGDIYDQQGLPLAETIVTEGEQARSYPFAGTFAHVVGYTSDKGIKTGLEASYDNYLLGLQEEQKLDNYLRQLKGQPVEGLDIVTTLDLDIQTLGSELLQGKRGAIVALRPGTNEVLALVSAPTFDPNQLKVNWAKLNADEAQKPLLNRATQGLYPPGSVLKVMTGAGILEKNPEFEETFQCPGYIQVGNYRLNDLSVHGRVNFDEALKVSCNTTFAQMGLELGSQEFYNLALKAGFLKELEFDLGVKQSYIPTPSEIPREDLAQSAIGQGRILVTPIHMAMLASIVANEGKLNNPFLVSKIQTKAGKVIHKAKPDAGRQVFSEATAERLKNAMKKVVSEGTGVKAQINGIEVAGKTGSAENPHGPPHSWFIGFAPAENPQVIVAVVVENGGLGGREGTSIARAIMEEALKN